MSVCKNISRFRTREKVEGHLEKIILQPLQATCDMAVLAVCKILGFYTIFVTTFDKGCAFIILD